MKSKSVLVAVVCLLSLAHAQVSWGGESERTRAQVYALEGLGALGGGACCAFGGCAGLWALAAIVVPGPIPFEQPPPGLEVAELGLLAVSVVGATSAAAYGTIQAGERLGEDGSSGWAFGGACAGALVGTGIACLGIVVSQSDGVRIPSFFLGGLCIPTGAVVGYNLGPKRETGRPYWSGLGRSLQPPGVALTGVELPDHSVEYGVKVQLAGLRF